MSQVVRFEKVSPEHYFYFIDFSIVTIGTREFLKINILNKLSNDTFSIYKGKNDDLYDFIADLDDFEDIDDKIFVVYKNGRLKFDFRVN